MKYLKIVLLALILSSCAKNGKFSVDINVDGLAKGDTIIIERVDVYDWSTLKEDTIFVSQEGFSHFEDTLSDAYLFSIKCKPIVPFKYDQCTSGLSVFIDAGDRIRLEADSMFFFVTPSIAGGVYRDSVIAEFSDIERKSDSCRIVAYNNYQIAADLFRGNRDTVNKYLNEFNSIRSSREQKKMESFISDSLDNSKYAAFLFINKAKYYENVPEMISRYERFSPQVQNSAIGRAVKHTLDIRKNLMSGEDAPDFTLIDKNGVSRSLSDYKGKYLLMYHWGICGGVMQIHPSVASFYEKYHSKGVEILGTALHDISSEFIGNKALEEVFSPVVNCQWPTVFTDNSDNKFIEEIYMLQGTPMFTFISPEGKVLFHGFHDAFYDAREMMSKTYPD